MIKYDVIETKKQKDGVFIHEVQRGGKRELIKYSAIRGGISWPSALSPAYYCILNRPIKDTSHVFLCLDKFNFCSEHYGQPFQYRQKFMAKLCEKADVKSFGFHAIRHFTATLLYQKGYSVAVIQAILRHKSPSTTERYLKSLGLEGVRGALEDLSLHKGKILKFEPRVIEGSRSAVEIKKPSKELSTPLAAV